MIAELNYQEFGEKRSVYLDYQASTPIDSTVLDSMWPYMLEEFGNPHSASHDYGRRAAAAISIAQTQVADLVESAPEDVIFTSGATEANNLVLRGLAKGWGTGKPRYLILSTEHPSVLEPAKVLAEEGQELVQIRVTRDGLVDMEQLEAELQSGPALVSVGAVNGEIGTIQPLERISELCRFNGSLLHTDASQAVGKVPLSFYKNGIDLLTLSGHKIYGPKGIGALVITPEIRRHLKPMILGGGQQDGLRAGTLPTPLCVGLGTASRIALSCWQDEAERLSLHRDRLLKHLCVLTSDVEVNGSLSHRLPGNLNLRFTGVDALQLISELPDLAISAGSACASSNTKIRPSHVLQAIGLTDEEIRSSVRIGMGRFTVEQDLLFAANALARAVRRVRSEKI